ncbi:Plexin-D1 like [Melia azedarach]|uniref:Plexin-D1 like n=1 Tax=Melia azedarach TaxID=155640 RepID=A0ACC1XMQ9_MELAZ|nr:Plexin-D1 like [Melia azedarach]
MSLYLMAELDYRTTASEMSSLSKFSYHRLRYDREFDEEADREWALGKTRKWCRIRKFKVGKRLKLRIPGLRRLSRKRARFLTRVKVSCKKALKRLKKGQAHINDLFGGSYLVMQQVKTTTMKCGNQRPIMAMGHGLHGLPLRYSLGKIA